MFNKTCTLNMGDSSTELTYSPNQGRTIGRAVPGDRLQQQAVECKGRSQQRTAVFEEGYCTVRLLWCSLEADLPASLQKMVAHICIRIVSRAYQPALLRYPENASADIYSICRQCLTLRTQKMFQKLLTSYARKRAHPSLRPIFTTVPTAGAVVLRLPETCSFSGSYTTFMLFSCCSAGLFCPSFVCRLPLGLRVSSASAGAVATAVAGVYC